MAVRTWLSSQTSTPARRLIQRGLSSFTDSSATLSKNTLNSKNSLSGPTAHFEFEQLGKDLFRLPLRHRKFFRDRCEVHLFASEPLKIPAESQAVHSRNPITPIQSHSRSQWIRAGPFSIIIFRRYRRRTLAPSQSLPTDSS